jgi:tetratricopeptide (TPR) repeat protein
MRTNALGQLPRKAILCCLAALLAQGQDQSGSGNVRDLIQQGNEALEKNQLHTAAEAFQRAVDINPSSAKAHEGLGVTLSREIIARNTRPSEDSDVVDRAESHLRRATELSPSASKPWIQFAELEGALADGATSRAEKSDRYRAAQDLLKRAVSLEPGKADLYLQLARLERDEFGPAIQKAKGQFSKTNGPIPDVDLRRELQQQYGSVIDDAISNARSASEMDGHSARPLLLVARLLRERALIRDTQQDYSLDMHSADDWQRQFLAAGGHLDQGEASYK